MNAQLPSYGDLGFLNTYKEFKFYWGISFENKGQIKSIDQVKYYLKEKSGKLVKGKKKGEFDNDSNIYIEFDKQGNIIKTIEQLLGKYEIDYTNNFDDYGNLIEIKGCNPKGEWINLERYTYDSLGKLILEERFPYTDVYQKYVYKYDENGNNIETLYTKIEGYSIFEFLLDLYVLEDSNRVEDLCLRIKMFYDKNENLIKEETYDSNCNWDVKLMGREPRDIYICEYDSIGRILKEFKKMDRAGDGKSTIKLNHNYDTNGLKTGTKLKFDFGGIKFDIDSEIIRDINGNVIEIIENQKTSFNKTIYKEKFEYDEYNNISKIYFYRNSKPKYLIEREIEYYSNSDLNY